MGNSVPLLICLSLAFVACAPDPATTPYGDPASLALDKNSAAVATSDCAACVFGPRTYTRATGAPLEDRSTFPGDPVADYLIDIDDGASEGADASVTLNDVVQLAPRTKVDAGPRHVRRAVSLLTQNSLKVRLTGKPGSKLTVSILGGTKAIGPHGGTIVVPGGRVTLTVPPGALPVDIEVTVAPDTSPNWADPSLESIGFAYHIDLHGAKLTIPGEIRFALPDGDDNGLIDGTNLPLADAAFLRYEPARDAWTEPLQWLDDDGKTLVIQTTEFSGWKLWAPLVWGGLPRQLLWDIDMSDAPPSTSTTGLVSQVQLAFSMWQAETGAAGLTFRRILSGENPDIVVEFADLEFGSTGVTYGEHTYGLGKRYVRLNKNLSVWGSPVSYLADVVIHEVGHAIGMRHMGNGEEPPIMAPQPNFQPDLHLYQADVDQVRSRYNIASPEVETLSSSAFPYEIATVGSTLVFTQIVAPQGLYKIPTSGGGVAAPLAAGLSGPTGVATDGSSIFWIEVGGAIKKIPAAGGPITTLASGLVNIDGRLVAEGAYLYFISDNASNAPTIRRIATSGGAIGDIVSGAAGSSDLVFTVNAGTVYFSDLSTGFYNVSRVAGGGGSITRMTASGIGGFTVDLVVSGNNLYLLDFFLGIRDLPISAIAASPTTLVVGANCCRLATDGTSLFVWRGDNALRRYLLSDFGNVKSFAAPVPPFFAPIPVGRAVIAFDAQYVYWIGSTTVAPNQYGQVLLKARK